MSLWSSVERKDVSCHRLPPELGFVKQNHTWMLPGTLPGYGAAAYTSSSSMPMQVAAGGELADTLIRTPLTPLIGLKVYTCR